MDINQQLAWHDGNTSLHLLCKSEEINDVQQKIRLVEKVLDGPGDLEVNAKNIVDTYIFS